MNTKVAEDGLPPLYGKKCPSSDGNAGGTAEHALRPLSLGARHIFLQTIFIKTQIFERTFCMKELLEKIRQDALSALRGDESSESVRIRFLGKKGELTSVLRGMGAVAPEERPKMGQLVNEVREKIENAIAEKA